MTLDDLYRQIDWSSVDEESDGALESVGENLKKEILDPERKYRFRCTLLQNLLYNRAEEARVEAFRILGPDIYDQTKAICTQWGIWPDNT